MHTRTKVKGLGGSRVYKRWKGLNPGQWGHTARLFSSEEATASTKCPSWPKNSTGDQPVPGLQTEKSYDGLG